MKTKISISIDTETLSNIDNILTEGLFRNKSHVIEYAIKKFLEKKR